MKEDILKILEYNKPEFNYIKLGEELAELSEVVIKRFLRKDPHKPPLAKIVEECGDVLLRIRILSAMEGLDDEINERQNQKKEKLLKYIANGEYKGGV